MKSVGWLSRYGRKLTLNIYFPATVHVWREAYVRLLNPKPTASPIPRSYVEFFFSSFNPLVTIYILKPYGSLVPAFLFFNAY